MARFLKYAGIVLAVLAGLLILLVVVVNIIPGEKYKSLISSGVKSATGRELTIEGDFDLKLLSSLAFKASGVKFANAEWGSRPHMMSVDNIEGAVALFPLLKGILDATLVVDGPDLLLETDTSGQGNWQFGDLEEEAAKGAEIKTEAEKEAESGGGLPIRPLIRKLHLNGTRITFLDGKSGDQINFQSEKLHIGSPEDMLAIDLKGKFNDIPLAFSGGLDNAGFFVDNKPANVKLDGHFGDAKLAVTGTAGPLTPTFDLDIVVNLDTDSVAAFSLLAGRELPDIGPLSASAKLTGKEGKYAVSDLLTTLDDKTLKAEAKGSITDLTAFSGLKLDAKVNTGHLTEILIGIGLQTEYKLPDSLNAEVVAEGNLDNLAIKNFNVKIHGRGLNAIGNAEVKNIISLEGVKADLALDTESLDLISEIVKTELPPFGPLKATASIVSKGENLGLMEIKADINGKIIHADIAGSIGDPLKLKDVNADVNIGVDSLAWLADYIKTKLPTLGSLKASANIASKGDTFEIKNIKAVLAGKNITAKVAGSVGDLLKVKGIDAKVDLGVQSLDFLSDYVKMKLPPLGPLKASANIASKGETFEIKNLKANLAGDKLHAKVAGSVGDLLKLKAINADVDLGIESLALLSDIAKTELPPLGPLNASASIISKGETFAVKNIKVDLADDKIHAKVAGSIGDLLKLKAINADVDLGIESLALLSDIAKTELPPLGPLNASARIVSKGETFEVKNIKADLAGEKIQVKVAGSVEDVLKLTGINADINFAVDSLSSLGTLVKKELPASSPVTLDGKFSSEGGLKAPTHIDTVIKSDGIMVSLTGSIAEPLAAKGIDLALGVEAESLEKVGKLTGAQLQGQKPVKLKGKFTVDENTYELAGLHLQAGDLDVKGKAAFTQPSEPGGRPRLNGELRVGKLDLSKLQAKADTSAEKESSPETREEEVEKEDKAKKDKIFSSEPLPFGPLKSVDADIDMTVESLITPQLKLDNIVVRATLENGLLNVKPLQAQVGQGTIEGTVMLDARNKPASLSADIEMTDATFHNFGGKLNFLIDLDGSGDSIAAIMAGLNGQLMFDVREATLKKSFMTGFGAGLLDSLNPFDKKEDTTELICAVILFDIEDGIADANKKIAAQMTDVTWFGSGEINLKTEEIDFGVRPKTRKVLDIGLGSLANLVHIGGTLAEPKVQLDPKDVAVKYGKYTAAMATGGLTLAADLLWGKIKANTNVCAKILEDLEDDE